MSNIVTESAPHAQIATFAAGCFWGVEADFREVPGVLEALVGYEGGTTQNPTYRDVCSNQTGHAEVVQVNFDPAQVSVPASSFYCAEDLPPALSRETAPLKLFRVLSR